MPRTITQAFDLFHSNLKPSESETAAATQHRESIHAALKNEYGTLTYFFRSGSFGNGTSVKGYSDVDYMAIIPASKLHNNSYTDLVNVKTVLDNRFPRTGVYINTPAVVVPFGTSANETTEITPGDYQGETAAGQNIYEIPKLGGGWMRTSPSAHNAYVTEANKAINFEIKPFIRFIKAWKYFNGVDISSFYLEMRATKYYYDAHSKSGSGYYIYDIRHFFKYLADNSLPSLQDPTGVAGYIEACSTDSKKETALSRIRTAATRSDKAYTAFLADNDKDAFEWLDLLFNGNFPSYYF